MAVPRPAAPGDAPGHPPIPAPLPAVDAIRVLPVRPAAGATGRLGHVVRWGRRAALLALAAVAALGAVPAGAQAPRSGPPLPAPIVQAMRAAGVPVADTGLLVLPLQPGEPLLALNPDAAMNPASTMKLLTTYQALSTLGPAYRWRTTAHLRGRLVGDVLDGDLVLRGGGDPKLVIEDLTEFVARLRAAGLREIRGDLVLDDGVYDLEDRRSVEQFDGDPSQPYNVRPNGLMMNFKATKLVVQPGAGDAVTVRTDPPLADVAIDADIRTARGACKYGAGGLVVRSAGTEFKPLIRISGPYSVSCGEQGTFAAVLDHQQFGYAIFKAAWTAGGGVLAGSVRTVPGAASQAGAAFVEWVSPRTLADVVADVNKFSNNVMARQLLLQSAAESTRRPATAEAARNTLVAWLSAQRLDIPELVVENGSGLSRRERISAASMVRVLLHAARNPAIADLYRESLPRVGIDGTMRNRLVRDPVAGRAWIKTGTLADVKTIAGYVDAASGRRYALAMFVNGQRAEMAPAVQDALLRWIFQNG